MSPDSPKIVQTLSRFFKIIVNPIVCRWSKTQGINISEQLHLGIRYLDLRLVCKNGEFYLAHGLYGGLLYPYLSEINNFLNNNRGEVVILDFQHFYEFTAEDHEKLMSNLRSILGDKMCLRQDVGNVSLNYLTGIGRQILTVYRNEAAKANAELWPSGILPTPWPDKLSTSDLIPYLDNKLKTRNQSIGLVSQCVLTVNTWYVVKHLFGSLKNMASTTNEDVIPWIKSKNNGPNGVNVIICDFVEGSEFVKDVIELNYTNMSKEIGIKIM